MRSHGQQRASSAKDRGSVLWTGLTPLKTIQGDPLLHLVSRSSPGSSAPSFARSPSGCLTVTAMDAMLQHGKENDMCEIELGNISSGIIS